MEVGRYNNLKIQFQHDKFLAVPTPGAEGGKGVGGVGVWGGDGWTGSLVTVEGVAIVSWNMANYKLVYVREGLKKP